MTMTSDNSPEHIDAEEDIEELARVVGVDTDTIVQKIKATTRVAESDRSGEDDGSDGERGEPRGD